MFSNRHAKWFFFVVIAAALLLIAATPSPSPKDPWKGTWWRIDPYGDESLERVVFGGGGNFNYIDRGASVCGTDEFDNPIYAAHARGSADTIDATSFVGTAPILCMAHPPFVWADSWVFAWSYDPATDTLWDGGATPWTRTRP